MIIAFTRDQEDFGFGKFSTRAFRLLWVVDWKYVVQPIMAKSFVKMLLILIARYLVECQSYDEMTRWVKSIVQTIQIHVPTFQRLWLFPQWSSAHFKWFSFQTVSREWRKLQMIASYTKHVLYPIPFLRFCHE